MEGQSSVWRAITGVFTYAFFIGMIVGITFWGKPDNSLHASALSWCFTGFIGLLAAVGFAGTGGLTAAAATIIAGTTKK